MWRVVMWSPLVNGANDAQQIHRRHPVLGKGCIAAHRDTNMASMGGGHKNGSMLMLIASKIAGDLLLTANEEGCRLQLR